MTQPTSKAILVDIGEIQLGKISLTIICNLEAPINSAFFTKYSFAIEMVCPYTKRVYQGHHIKVTASIEFIILGFRMEAIHRAKIKAGTARNTSVKRMITVS